MRTLLVSVLTTGSLAACIQSTDEVHPVGRAIPTADAVAISLPDSGNLRIGELSPWYVATRDLTRTLNHTTGWVLLVVHTIVQFPPTDTADGTAVWGPGSDALDPAEYKLVVSAAVDGSYDWVLAGRNKTEPSAAFQDVIWGNAVPSEPEGQGTGTFTIDFDAGRAVNPVDASDARGTVEVAYDLRDKHLDLAVDTIELRDDVETPVAYTYEYDEATDRSGNMVFQIHADTEDDGPLAEDVTLRSRWTSAGAGRADLRLEHGDLDDAAATASQCWSTAFRTVYSEYSFDATLSEGDAADCAYATASVPE